MDHTPLVSAREALSWLGEPDVRFVDVTWFMPNVPSSAHDAYEMEHIPGASYFDIEKISDASIDLPHMYPSLDKFEYCIGKLGISESDHVVVYDRSNFVASARAWWMFVSFGHEACQSTGRWTFSMEESRWFHRRKHPGNQLQIIFRKTCGRCSNCSVKK